MSKATESILRVGYYLLIPINIALMLWVIIMTHAYIRPTSRLVAYNLRSQGLPKFSVLFALLILSCVLVGVTNVYVVYRAYKDNRKRYKRFKRKVLCGSSSNVLLKTVAGIGLTFIGVYPILAATAFRDAFANMAWRGACDGYVLMAEIKVLSDFPAYNGTPTAPIYDASSEIRFYKNWEYQYTMDLVRAHNQTLGFKFDRNGPGNENNGTFELALRTDPTKDKPAEYFNLTRLVDDQKMGRSTSIPGPVGKVHYDLYNSTYKISFTNTSAPGFPPVTLQGNLSAQSMDLSFPGLRLSHSNPDRRWRFTDDVCLPPRVSLKEKPHVKDDVHGEFSHGCRSYRLCALKNGQGGSDWPSFHKWVESVWPAVVGLVTWEFEEYSLCCRRGE